MWRNPRILGRQVVVHPEPPAGQPAEGWNVVVDAHARDTVTLERDGMTSVIDARRVVDANRERFLARFEVLPDS